MFFAFACDLGHVNRQGPIRAEHAEPEEPNMQLAVLQAGACHFARREHQARALTNSERLESWQRRRADAFYMRIRTDASHQRKESVMPRFRVQALDECGRNQCPWCNYVANARSINYSFEGSQAHTQRAAHMPMRRHVAVLPLDVGGNVREPAIDEIEREQRHILRGAERARCLLAIGQMQRRQLRPALDCVPRDEARNLAARMESRDGDGRRGRQVARIHRRQQGLHEYRELVVEAHLHARVDERRRLDQAIDVRIARLLCEHGEPRRDLGVAKRELAAQRLHVEPFALYRSSSRGSTMREPPRLATGMD